ncbi:sensor histidine kinase [Roseivivax sp. CAU 1761]
MELGGLVAAMPLAALYVGPDERIRAANAAAAALLGPGLEDRHYITALRQPQILDAVEQVRGDGATRRTRFLGNDGQQDTSFRVTAAAVAEAARRGVLVSFEDETSLAQAEQMRRDFVANVSHELKTPLTALIGFIETLRGPARNDPAARDRFLSVMESEAGRMNRLVSDLLSLSRVEAEERMRPTDRVDLGALVAATLRGLAPLAERSGSEIVTDLPAGPLDVPAAADQLRQVVLNLVENALKYAGEGARVTVRLTGPAFEPRLRGAGARLAISDTGPGLDPIHIPRLTQRFYRVDTHRSRSMGGTGLGLAIVKHIVNRHRGRLEIESAPGRGSTFTILLPVA